MNRSAGSYIVRRLLQLIPLLLGVTLLTFAMLRFAAGDAVELLYENLGTSVSQAVLDAKRAELGLDQPFFVQYGRWLWDLLHGDLGTSYVSGVPVLPTLLSKVPATLLLTGASLGLTILISVPLGIVSAVFHGRWIDYLIRAVSFVGNSLPNFFAALHEGRTFDFRTWDEGWCKTDTLSRVKPFAEPLTAACKLVEATRDITPDMVRRSERAVCCWLPFDFAQERTRLSFTIGHEQFRRMRGLRFVSLRGSEPVTLEKLRITASRHCWAEQEPALRLEPGGDAVTLRVEKLEVEAPMAKEFTVTLTLRGRPGADNYTAVELLY